MRSARAEACERPASHSNGRANQQTSEREKNHNDTVHCKYPGEPLLYCMLAVEERKRSAARLTQLHAILSQLPRKVCNTLC